MNFADRLKTLPWILGALIVTSCFHEAGHAWAAWRLGDRRDYTRRRSRFWSPSHISIPFTLVAPSLLWLWAGIGLGGAVPVMVSTRAISPWKMTLVALAGPAGNIFCGVLSLLALATATHLNAVSRYDDVYHSAVGAVGLSFFLAGLNLLPIPPLDGSRVVAAFMPETLRNAYLRLGLPCAIILMVSFFVIGKYYPEKLSFLYEFYGVTIPRWTLGLSEFVR